MIYYIATETGKAVRSRYAGYYLAGVVAVCVLANLAMVGFRDIIYGTNDGTFGYNIIMFAEGFFWIPYYSCIFIADLVCGRQYPDPYLRDRSNIGLKRHDIFFGKLISEFIMLFIFTILSFVIFILVTMIFQIYDGSIDSSIILDFAYNLLIAVPLFMAGTAIGNMFLFAFEGKKYAYTGYIITIIVIPRIVMLLGAAPFSIAPFCWIKDKILLTPQFTSLQFFATRDVSHIIISSVIFIILSSIVGCICYNKKVFEG